MKEKIEMLLGGNWRAKAPDRCELHYSNEHPEAGETITLIYYKHGDGQGCVAIMPRLTIENVLPRLRHSLSVLGSKSPTAACRALCMKTIKHLERLSIK